MAVNIKIGESAISGRVGGVWSAQDKKFVIKRGKTKNDKKYQVFSVKVASKDKDSGTWTNGKDIEVMLYGETKVEEGQDIGLLGKFQPNNWEKDGKEMRGNQFIAFEDGIFTPDSWDSNTENPEPEEEEPDEMPW